MDQYTSAIIVAIITGIVSIVSLVIQKRQDKVIDRIDEHTAFIDRERVVKQKIEEKEYRALNDQIMMLILDTNLRIMEKSSSPEIAEEAEAKSNELKARFEQVGEEINQLRHEHQLVLEMAGQFQSEIEKLRQMK